jgi:hypothetical protein
MDIVAVLAGLPAVLTALGEHLPGLLVAAAMIYLYIQREKVITADKAACKAADKEHIQEYKDVVDKLFTIADATNASLNSISINLAAANRNSQIGEKLDALAEQINVKEVKANGNAKRGAGQTSGKTG